MQREEEEPPHPLQFKVVLLGAAGVGKTTIATTAAGSQASQTYRRTVGVDFYKAHLALPGETLVSVQMWDVGSGVSSLQMAANYLHGCDAVLMVYDISRAQTLVLVHEWLVALMQLYSSTPLPYLGLVGNKRDLLQQAQLQSSSSSSSINSINSSRRGQTESAAAALSPSSSSSAAAAVSALAVETQVQQRASHGPAPVAGQSQADETDSGRQSAERGAEGASSMSESLTASERIKQHKDMAAVNDMRSFLIEATVPDEVTATITQVAADLAGVPLTVSTAADRPTRPLAAAVMTSGTEGALGDGAAGGGGQALGVGCFPCWSQISGCLCSGHGGAARRHHSSSHNDSSNGGDSWGCVLRLKHLLSGERGRVRISPSR